MAPNLAGLVRVSPLSLRPPLQLGAHQPYFGGVQHRPVGVGDREERVDVTEEDGRKENVLRHSRAGAAPKKKKKKLDAEQEV